MDQSKAQIPSDYDDEVYDSDSGDDNVSSCSDDYDLVSDLRSRIRMILDLIPSLESTIEHQKTNHYKHPHARKPGFCASGPAQIYISLVHDKFPKANQKLKERLGEANWQRHLNIRRRMDQYASNGDHEPVQTNAGNGKDTISGLVFQPKLLFHDSGIGTTVAAQSQYAQTEASHTSIVSSIAQNQKGTPRVPQTPVEVGDSKPFRCYICGVVQSKIRSRIDWK